MQKADRHPDRYAASVPALQKNATSRNKAGGKSDSPHPAKAKPGSLRRIQALLTCNPTIRGLPAGYLNSLEKRLAETERALFFALAEIHETNIEDFDYRNAELKKPSAQSKADLILSWAQYPLDSRANLKSWFLDRQRDADIPPATPANLPSSVNSDRSGPEPQGTLGPGPWPTSVVTPGPARRSGSVPTNQDLSPRVFDTDNASAWAGRETGINNMDMATSNNALLGSPGSLPAPVNAGLGERPSPRPESVGASQGRASILAEENKSRYF